MKFQNVAIISGVLAFTVLAFQNCSNVSFQEAISEEASKGIETPIPEKPPVCEVITADSVQPKVRYAWDYAKDVEPTYKQVMASPVVGDINGDKIPEIAFVSYKDSLYTGKGVLRVLNGKTGATLFSISDDNLAPFASTTPLLVDIDRDGLAEIVYVHYLGKKAIALNYDGTLRWELPLDFSGTGMTALSGCMESFAAADIDNDRKTEIVAGPWIISESIDKRPSIRSRLSVVTNSCLSYPVNLLSGLSTGMQVLSNYGVFDVDGKLLWKYLYAGNPATADLYADVPGSEVIVVGSDHLVIYSAKGDVLYDNKLSEHADLLCSGKTSVGGGQATIGDFDGDSSTLEIAVATGKSLTIFNSKGQKIAGSTTQDCSSLQTGITSFDFNGDGKPEIIYADEQYVRIFSMDGSNNLHVVWSEINPSGTLKEYPVVADVDGDGYAELVVVANNMWVDANSIYQTTEQKDLARNVTGLRVFSPKSERAWMPTRPVWNQHAYLASNVDDDLKATSSTLISGAYPTFFKRNIQKGLFQQTCEAVK
jgi:hypothetical protein